MNEGKTIFRRIRGRIIPIRTGVNIAQNTARAVSVKRAAAVSAVSGVASGIKKQDVKPNQFLKYAGLGLALTSGAVGALTFTGGKKSFWGGLAGGFALDAASSASNVAAYSGRGKLKQRFKAGIKQEAINTLAGNAVFAAGLIALPRNRKAIKYGAKAVFNFIRRVK